MSLGSAAPVKALGHVTDAESDGWGGSSATFGGNGSGKPSAPAPAQGWLGGDSAAAVEEESSSGWLGDSRTTKVGAPAGASDGDGWLGGEEKSKAPSMTEMVDRAIGVEEADDFVDDSWVDEEVGNGEFDDLEIQDHAPPTPEVGGAFLKMVLVAVLVLLIGGGVMFMSQEQKTPEQLQAEEMAKELEFARSSVQTGKNYLQEGKALLAIGPLEAAMTSLKTAGGSETEILQAKTELARAFMKAQEYQKAYDHWIALAKGPEEFAKEAKLQMAEASKLLRIQANDQLVEAAEYIKNGESSSVIDLGESALKIFNTHQGLASQKGKAYGVIGRGCLNGKEYGKAKEYLKKAMSLNPAGGYGADLARIASETAPVNYYGGGGADYESETVRSAKVVKVEASIGDDGPSYQTGPRISGGSRRKKTTNATSSSASSPPAVSSKPRTREIPAYQRPSQSSSGGARKGDKGVVPGYR
jgi:tetratricopeptide (TPR) repeat protein